MRIPTPEILNQTSGSAPGAVYGDGNLLIAWSNVQTPSKDINLQLAERPVGTRDLLHQTDQRAITSAAPTVVYDDDTGSFYVVYASFAEGLGFVLLRAGLKVGSKVVFQSSIGNIGPAAVMYKDRLYVAYAESKRFEVLISRLRLTKDGNIQSDGSITPGVFTRGDLTLVASQDRLILGYIDETSSLVTMRGDGQSFADKIQAPITTRNGRVALANRGGRTYAAYVNPDSKIVTAYSNNDGKTFTGFETSEQSSHFGPALVPQGHSSLAIVWTGTDADQRLNLAFLNL